MEKQGTEIPREKVLLCPDTSRLETRLAEPEELGGLPSPPAEPRRHEADRDRVRCNASYSH